MLLHDSIVWAIGPDGASGIDFYCDESKSEEIAHFFMSTFEKYWSEAQDAIEEDYGDCYEKDGECGVPALPKSTDFGVRVLMHELFLSYSDGDRIESDEYANKALENTLAEFVEKYPDISYEGYIGFRWSDINSGGVRQYEVSSKDKESGETDRIYDFVGEAIAAGLDDEDFWDELYNQLCDADVEDFKEVLESFQAYKKWILDDTIDNLLEIADEVDEDIREELEEM